MYNKKAKIVGDTPFQLQVDLYSFIYFVFI